MSTTTITQAPCPRCGGFLMRDCECEAQCRCAYRCDDCGTSVSAARYEDLVLHEREEVEEAARAAAEAAETERLMPAFLALFGVRMPNALEIELHKIGISQTCPRCGGDGYQASLDERERDRGVEDVCYCCCTKGYIAPPLTIELLAKVQLIIARGR